MSWLEEVALRDLDPLPAVLKQLVALGAQRIVYLGGFVLLGAEEEKFGLFGCVDVVGEDLGGGADVFAEFGPALYYYTRVGKAFWLLLLPFGPFLFRERGGFRLEEFCEFHLVFYVNNVQWLLIILDLSYRGSIASQHPSLRLTGPRKHREYCNHTNHKEYAKRCHCSIIINSDNLFVQILLHHLLLLDYHLLLHLTLLTCHFLTFCEV